MNRKHRNFYLATSVVLILVLFVSILNLNAKNRDLSDVNVKLMESNQQLVEEMETLKENQTEMRGQINVLNTELGKSKRFNQAILESNEKLKSNLESSQSANLKLRKEIDNLKKKNTLPQVSRGSSSFSGKSIYVQATGYTPWCNGCSGFTATGIDVRTHQPNIIAVDPRVIPLGTKVELLYTDGRSMGYYTAADKGGAIKGYKIDVLFSSKREALNFGNRKMIIRILN